MAPELGRGERMNERKATVCAADLGWALLGTLLALVDRATSPRSRTGPPCRCGGETVRLYGHRHYTCVACGARTKKD